MNYERKKLVNAIAYAMGAAAFAAGGPVAAQAPINTTPDVQLKVDVVGSGIKRYLEDQSQPVTIMTSDDIKRLGVQNMEQLLQKISATAGTGATFGATLAGTSTFGSSGVSLRGLGATRTLVLLDGMRLTPFAQELSSGVDINAIPISAIDRVEVLLDGASSIYGSDAEAGVINFRLRRDYTGATVGYEYDWPTRGGGGGRTNNLWASVGVGELKKDNYNLTLNFQYKREDSLLASTRSFSRTGNQPPYLAAAATPSGRIEAAWDLSKTYSSDQPFNPPTAPFGYTTTGFGNPGADSPGCAAMLMYNVSGKPKAPSTGKNCSFDSAPFVELFPSTETTSGIGKLYLALTPNDTLYFTGLYTENIVNEAIQPSPIRGSFLATDNLFAGSGVAASLLIYPGNPNYPTAWLNSHGLSAMVGQPLSVSYRAFAAGERTERDTNTQQNWVAGVKGTWLKDWDYDINAQWGQSESKGTVTDGYFSQLQFVKAWNTVGNTAGSYVDPWSVGGVQNNTLAFALKAANYVGPTATAKETLTTANAHTVGDIYTLPAGPVTMNIGGSYYRGKYDVSVPEILGTGDIAGLGGAIANQSGDRNVWSGYVEFALPITKEIALDVSGRVDHYSDLAAENTPVTGKVSGTWKPWAWGLFRGSVGNGFRAPTLGELHKPVVTGTTEQYIDPLFVSDGPVQSNNLNGGNINLVPEKSLYASGGFVWTPALPQGWGSLTFAADYWYLRIKNYITTPSALALINVARAGGFVYHPGEVVFSVPGDVNTAVDSVDETFQNAGTATFEGIDFRGNWRIPSSFGLWSIDYNGTYYIKADLQQQSVVEHNVGTIVDTSNQVPLAIPLGGGVILRYKQILSLNWSYGPWGATLVNNYITGYHTAPNQEDGTTPHSVPSFMTWDLQGTWSATKNVQLTFGARNLFDKDPNLFIPTANFFQYGYDPTTYDPRGRVLYARAVVTF